MKAVAVFLAFASATATAQMFSPKWQLPNWAQQRWTSFSEAHMLDLSLRLNPFVWQGDFDGDQALDLALLVKRRSDGKEGIAVLWRSGAAPTVIGAGSRFVNGQDDFSWIDYWGVEESGSLHESHYQDTIRLEADALLVIKEASASGLIYFENGVPKWQQQGD